MMAFSLAKDELQLVANLVDHVFPVEPELIVETGSETLVGWYFVDLKSSARVRSLLRHDLVGGRENTDLSEVYVVVIVSATGTVVSVPVSTKTNGLEDMLELLTDGPGLRVRGCDEYVHKSTLLGDFAVGSGVLRWKGDKLKEQPAKRELSIFLKLAPYEGR